MKQTALLVAAAVAALSLAAAQVAAADPASPIDASTPTPNANGTEFDRGAYHRRDALGHVPDPGR